MKILANINLKQMLPIVLLVGTISNFCLSCSLFRSSNPHEIIHTVVVTNYVDHAGVATNDTSSLSRFFSSTGTVSLASVDGLAHNGSVSAITNAVAATPRSVCTTSYQYFLVGGKIGCRMFGRYYYDGSPTSYGRIEAIYPDRILLFGGDWITNGQQFQDGLLASSDRVSFRSSRHD